MTTTTALQVPVARIMRGPVATVDAGRTMREVAAALAADEIGAVLVDGAHGPIGIAVRAGRSRAGGHDRGARRHGSG